MLIFFKNEIHLLQVDDELEIKAYYAGHVLGAAMFHMKVGAQSLVYTVSICLQFHRPWNIDISQSWFSRN